MAGGTRLASVLLLSVFLFVRAQNNGQTPTRISDIVNARRLFSNGNVNVTLRCSTFKTPSAIYEWFWNGTPFQSSNQSLSYDTSSGILTIKGLNRSQEGLYNCLFHATFPNGKSSMATFNNLEVRGNNIRPQKINVDKTQTATEGDYVSIACGDTLPKSYVPTTFKWYTGENNDDLIEVEEDDRIFVDSEGTLHFAHVLESDELANRFYYCVMKDTVERQITLGRTRLVVSTFNECCIAEVKPTLQFSTKTAGQSALTFELNTEGRLECFFSGYEHKTGNEVPTIEWQNNAGNTIVSGTDRYTIESNNRVLKIARLVEADESLYICICSNRLGRAEGTMVLNVTSSPIWVKPLQSTTVPQDQDAVFHCQARSARGEVPPDPPRWFKDGQRLDMTSDTNKFAFSNEKRELRVKSAQKNTEIACFQCYVENSVGEELGEGCLNVIDNDKPNIAVIAGLSAVGGILVLVIVLLAVLYKRRGTIKCFGTSSNAVPPDVSAHERHERRVVSFNGEGSNVYCEIDDNEQDDGYLRPVDCPPETTNVKQVYSEERQNPANIDAMPDNNKNTS